MTELQCVWLDLVGTTHETGRGETRIQEYIFAFEHLLFQRRDPLLLNGCSNNHINRPLGITISRWENMHNCCSLDNFLPSSSIPKQDFVAQNVVMRQSNAGMHGISVSPFAFPHISAGDSSDHCLSVEARHSPFYGFINGTHAAVSLPVLEAADFRSNYDKFDSKLAVPPAGVSLVTHGQDKGGGSDRSRILQHRAAAPALTHCSNLTKRKIGLPVEAPKIKRSRASAKQNQQDEAHGANETSKPDFIHVRARRGQATDSHSLAERARREKINERMRLLRDLVPGCYKAAGKVVKQLDEIINYVQSLQNQVEVLSMKLSIASRHYDFTGEAAKELLPLGECGKTSVMASTLSEDAAARLHYCTTRGESLDKTCDSSIMETAFVDEVAFGFGTMDANQWSVDLQGGFQDQHRLL